MRYRQAGFSLLEILVAFSVMALAVVVLMRVFSGALQGIARAEDYARATSLAQSKIAQAGNGAAPQAGETAGVEADRYRWSVRVRKFQDPAAGAPLPPGVMMRVQLFEVDVAVAWGEPERAGEDRRVAMSTLVLAPKTDP